PGKTTALSKYRLIVEILFANTEVLLEMLRDETEPFLLLWCKGVKRLQLFDSFRDSLLCCKKCRLLIGSVFDHRDYIRQLFAVNFLVCCAKSLLIVVICAEIVPEFAEDFGVPILRALQKNP